jgi:hypothetical protein
VHPGSLTGPDHPKRCGGESRGDLEGCIGDQERQQCTAWDLGSHRGRPRAAHQARCQRAQGAPRDLAVERGGLRGGAGGLGAKARLLAREAAQGGAAGGNRRAARQEVGGIEHHEGLARRDAPPEGEPAQSDAPAQRGAQGEGRRGCLEARGAALHRD